MIELARGVDSKLARLGFAKEEKEFRAHITIGRARMGKFVRGLAGAIETVDARAWAGSESLRRGDAERSAAGGTHVYAAQDHRARPVEEGTGLWTGKKALDMALAQIEKQFGRGAILKLGEKPKHDVAVIPTGAISLDMALGVGGVPCGRITEIYGQESSAKRPWLITLLPSARSAAGPLRS